MGRTIFFYLVRIIAIFAIYFVTAKFGLNLQAISRFATLVWVPTGFSIAVLLLYGYRYWPGISLGAFFVNLFTGAPPVIAAGIASGNTLEAIVGVFILQRFFAFDTHLSKLKDVLSLVLVAAPLASAVSAIIGVTSLLIGHIILSSSYLMTWFSWWMGDAISCFIITPFLLLWWQGTTLQKSFRRTSEFIILICVVLIIGIFVFRGLFGIAINSFPITYLLYPPIIWAALRFGQREVAAIIVTYSGMAIAGTIIGFGPFANKDIDESFFALQFFMSVTSLTSLILAVVVAERKRLEERKDDFISMASHELKTPVTSLKLYMDITKITMQDKHFGDATKYLNKLDEQIYKLTSLVVDLLDVSRVQSGKLQVNKSLFNIDTLIADTVEALQGTTTAHTLLIKGQIKKDIIGDRQRIYQVLINLLTNAIKFSPEGGNIIIQCRRKRNDVQISVKDKGMGIDKDQLQKVFEKLYQVSDTKGQKTFPGLGIGLFVSAEIIKLHKGKIWVESKKGKGSTFYFTLPLVAELTKIQKNARWYTAINSL